MSVSVISELKGSPSAKKYEESGKYTFPSYEKVDPCEKKKPKYCLDVVKAAYSNLMRDRTAIPSGYYSYIQTLRDYGSGNQDEQLYSNRINDSLPTTNGATTTNSSSASSAARKGDANMSHKIVSIATNLKNAIHGMFDEYEEDLMVTSIDNESGAVEENAMFEALWEARNSQFANSMQQEYGIPIAGDSDIPTDVTAEELQIYKDSGGFKTAWAESMEELVSFTEKFSKWDRVLKRKLIDDGLDINFMSARVVYDESTEKMRWEYVDPANFVIQYSTDQMFENAEYAGYFTLENMGTLVEKGFDSAKLIATSRNYKDLFDNPTDIDWGRLERTSELTDKIFDFKIPVFHFNWIDVDVKKQARYTNTHGKTTIYDMEFDEEFKPINKSGKKKGIKKEPMNTRIKRAYQASWVVDSDMMYDFGPVPNQTRKSSKEAKLSFIAWKGITTNKKLVLGSIIESIIPFLDHLHIGWMKYQDAMVKAHPGGYAINIRLLQNLKIGGDLIDPLEAYKMFYEKGVLPYMDSPLGENYKGGSVMPLTRIEGTQGQLMNVIQGEIAFVIQMIERITGINPAATGVAPDSDQPVASTQMALQGTSTVLKPLVSAIFEIKEGLGTETTKRAPLLFRNMPKVRKSYAKIIGEESVDIIRQAESSGCQYGLILEARPNGSEKQNLIQMVQQAMQRGRDGDAGITLGQGMYIIERVNNGGNFKKLQRQVDLMIRKAEQEAFEKKRALITEQNQQQAQIVQAKQQGDMQVKQMDTQATISIDNNKSRNKIIEMKTQANIDFKMSLYEEKSNALAAEQEVQQPQDILT